jgi:predicted Kef-type K+ transport protein
MSESMKRRLFYRVLDESEFVILCDLLELIRSLYLNLQIIIIKIITIIIRVFKMNVETIIDINKSFSKVSEFSVIETDLLGNIGGDNIIDKF